MGEGWPTRGQVEAAVFADGVRALPRRVDDVLALYTEAQRRGEPTKASERAALAASVGECCRGADPMCTAGCLVEAALRKRLNAGADAMVTADFSTLTDVIEAATARGWAEGIDAAAIAADAWADSKSCTHHDDNPCCHVRTGAGIAAAIRALERA